MSPVDSGSGRAGSDWVRTCTLREVTHLHVWPIPTANVLYRPQFTSGPQSLLSHEAEQKAAELLSDEPSFSRDQTETAPPVGMARCSSSQELD